MFLKVDFCREQLINQMKNAKGAPEGIDFSNLNFMGQ
jgi:hypothetical protein